MLCRTVVAVYSMRAVLRWRIKDSEPFDFDAAGAAPIASLASPRDMTALLEGVAGGETPAEVAITLLCWPSFRAEAAASSSSCMACCLSAPAMSERTKRMRRTTKRP